MVVVGEEEDGGGGWLEVLEQPEALIAEDLIAYFNAAEAGLAGQDRRWNARRLRMENGDQRVLSGGGCHWGMRIRVMITFDLGI